MASRNTKLRDFPEHTTELEHDESDEVEKKNNFPKKKKKEVDFTNNEIEKDNNDNDEEEEQEEQHQEDQEDEENEQEQEQETGIEENNNNNGDNDGEFESMEHIRKKMASMEAEAQQLLSLNRQINEKISQQNNHNYHKDDTSNNNNNNNNSNKDGTSLNSPNGNSTTTANLNSNTVTNVNANVSPAAATATNIKSSMDNLDPNVLGGGEKEEDQKALDERSVFVKNLDTEVGADQLKEYFESCGAIERITILANKFTGEARGCAYIQFKSKVAVANALLLDGKTWQGKEIEVKTKRTNLPIWMLERGRARGRGGFRGRSSFRGRGRGAFAYRGYRGGYRGRGYWHPYAGY